MLKMNFVLDACTVILLAKATVLESAAEAYSLTLPESVFSEVLAGRVKMFADALLTEKLVRNKLLGVARVKNARVRENLMQDFGMGAGEADTIALCLEGGFDGVGTDNKQGRKAATVNSLNLVGSPEIIMALFQKEKLSKEKAKRALKVLKSEGWFNDLLIERLVEEVEKSA